MRLTCYTDYCLRVLIYLAEHPGRRATIAEIARSYGISENHLVKVAHFLGRTGFLDNARGRGGGLTLARAPEAINIGTVVRSTDGPAMPAACFELKSPRCALVSTCRLRGVLTDAVAAFYGVLDRYTVGDLVDGGERHRRVRALLAIPMRAGTKR